MVARGVFDLGQVGRRAVLVHVVARRTLPGHWEGDLLKGVAADLPVDVHRDVLPRRLEPGVEVVSHTDLTGATEVRIFSCDPQHFP